MKNSVFKSLVDYLSCITLYYFLILSENRFNQNFPLPHFSETRNSKYKHATEKYITDSEMEMDAITTELFAGQRSKVLLNKEFTVLHFGNAFIKAQVSVMEQISHCHL